MLKHFANFLKVRVRVKVFRVIGYWGMVFRLLL
jgi:hypothetical protein